METYKTITKWVYPSNYFGEEFLQYFDVIYQNRDSKVLDRSNFRSFLKALGGESETVQVIRAYHWACGWIEFIGIHESDTKALEIADKIATNLKDYPVVDESDWSSLESEEAENVWMNSYDLRDRIRLCVQHGLSMFAARSEWIPQDDNGSLYEHLTMDL